MIYSRRSLVILLVGIGLACATSRERSDPPPRANSSPQHPPDPLQAPTERQLVLAQILTGHWVENPWFTSEDFESAGDLEFGPDGIPFTSHGGFVDRLGDPETCSVERTRFNHDGRPARVERVSIGCPQYWRKVRDVESYYLLRGFLPSSGSDLNTFLQRLVPITTQSID